jgi:hypothetical protein
MVVVPSPSTVDDFRISLLTGPSSRRSNGGAASASLYHRLPPLGVGVVASSSADDTTTSTSGKFVNDFDDNNNDIVGASTKRIRTVLGPDLDTKPDYENIHGPLGKTVDGIFLSVFRMQLARHVGVDSNRSKASPNDRSPCVVVDLQCR